MITPLELLPLLAPEKVAVRVELWFLFMPGGAAVNDAIAGAATTVIGRVLVDPFTAVAVMV